MIFKIEIMKEEVSFVSLWTRKLLRNYYVVLREGARRGTLQRVKWNEMKLHESWKMGEQWRRVCDSPLSYHIWLIDRENAIKMKVIIIVSANLQENCWIIPIYTTNVALFNENSNSKQFITY